MGVSLSVVFQKNMPDAVNGTVGGDNYALSENFDLLDYLLINANLTMLESFISVDAEEAWGIDEDSDMDEEMIEANATPPDWFPAKDGLVAVRAAMEYLKANEKELAKFDGDLMGDLENVEKELVMAEKENVDFHFAFFD